MTIQEHVVHTTRKVADEFFRYMEAMPADKLEWRPMETGQSALSMAQEVGITPTWAMSGMDEIPFNEAEPTEYRLEWKTIAQCKQEFNERFVMWSEFIVGLSETDLRKTKFLPFNGGRDHTFLELLEYPRWNITWHMGQVAYIQTLYGDHDMY